MNVSPCKRCGMFDKYADGRCGPCQRAAHKKYRIKYPEKHKSHCKRWEKENPMKRRENVEKARKKKYGLTLEQYELLVLNQNNKCAICFSLFIRTPQIDHNHKTNKTRGLLCGLCNKVLGLVHENIEVLESAILYLQNEEKNE